MLSVSRLIQVSVNAGAIPAVARTFNLLMIAGDSSVISGLQRFRSYNGLAAVGNDFGVTTPEYLAAEAYFDQTPTPNQNIMIGRWLSVATSGFNLGQVQTPAQQAISNWTSITSGGFDISIDGASAETLTSLNFSSVTNLNGVASIINGALTGAVCTWTGSAFLITSNSTGPGAFATGTISLTGQPSANDHFVINGTTVTFVASSPVGNQVVIGATSAATLANLLAFLQASTDSNIDQATYANNSGLIITITDKVAGTAGNSFSLTKSGSNLAVSASTLLGGTQPSSVGYATSPGSGTDISTLLGMTSTTSQGLANGYASETPAQCAQALAAASNLWYGLTFSTTATITTAQYLAVAPVIEGLTVTRMLGITTQDSNTLSPLVMNDLASLLSAGAYNHTFIQYSSTSSVAAASMFGRMFSVNFAAQNSTINLMYKQEPGITPENLNDTQANALEAKNCNVFVGYDNDTAIIQYGVCTSGNFIDQIWGSDWFQNAIQTSVYNLLYTAPTKIPQTDAGQNQLVNSCAAVCGNQPGGAVYNGFAGPGTWNSSTVFGNLQTGQFLSLGYYIFSASIDSQSESARAQRQAPPIQIALKLAGAFQGADIIVTVNQ